MAEQYIYSRAEKEIINALHQTIPVGYGFIRLSSGMANNALRDAVKKRCEDCPQLSQGDSQGEFRPLLRKVSLLKGRILLEESVCIKDSNRDFYVLHGYVLEDKELREFDPGKWFNLRFRLGNPNVEPLEAPLGSQLELEDMDSFRAKPLKETVELLGLCRSQFHQILLACFDAVASRLQVLIAWDFEYPAEWEFRRSVLYWIYTCLPYDLWSSLGFDSIYTDKSTRGEVHLAFVDKASVHDGSDSPCIQREGQPVMLGGSFLIRDGAIFRNGSKCPTEWYGQNGVFACWLEQLVNALWECSAEELPSITQALFEFRQSFQKQLDTRERRLNPQWYGTVCLKALDDAPQTLSEICKRVRSGVTERELYDFRLEFMNTFSETESQDILRELLETHKKSGARLEEEEAKMLGALFERGLTIPAAGLTSAFMAQEADAQETSITEILSRYQKLLPPKLYSMLSVRVLFGGLCEEEVKLWKDYGADNSEEAALRRRNAWFRENIPADKPVWESLASINLALTKLKGLNSQQQQKVWQEPFQEWCGSISGKALDTFADEQMPQNFLELQKGCLELPGGLPAGALDTLQQKVYDRLLQDPPPFIDGRWLREANNSWKNGGEIGEVLEILSTFTNIDRGDAPDWESCARGKSKNARETALKALPKMFLNGSLPKIRGGFMVTFFFLCPEASREILLQAARQGGRQLLLDLLNSARKWPWKHFNKLGREEPTIFCEIVRIAGNDVEIANTLGEEKGESAAFCEGLRKFLQEVETEKVRSSQDISTYTDALERYCF